MAKNLVIVESPAKSKTISKYLGKDFVIKASYGHVRDLPPYTLGVNVEENFEPKYQIIKDKKEVISEIKKLAKKADAVWLATDPDREGEAIAWHVFEGSEIPKEKIKRIVFNEITKKAVLKAIEEPREINYNLVNAQQARRILDRLIGYKVSPILSKKIRKGLSAGRVQSVAVKIICDREKEIRAFKPEEYWHIDGSFETTDKPTKSIKARLFAKGTVKDKIEAKTQKEAEKIEKDLTGADFMVDQINKKEAQRHPAPPFITSTLQQEASRKLHWTAKRTMIIAQQLYEGLSVSGEQVGLITYMRTDSFRLSDDAVKEARTMIVKKYGKEYISPQVKIYKKNKQQNVQDAHEAIRPSMLSLSPDKIENDLTKEQMQLYLLIWNRFMACQMASSKIEQTQVLIKGNDYIFKATGHVVLFDGFTKVYLESKDKKSDDDDEKQLPKLEEKQVMKIKELEKEQKFTQPPARYTEASLVKIMEEKGIGRPSTYAPTISTIIDRQYILRESRQLSPTELGELVDDKLSQFFKDIVSINFTADMETKLDEVTEEKQDWRQILKTFYDPFIKTVEFASENMEKINMDKPTDEICDKCSSPMVIKVGRFGEFIACTNYPDCKNTKAIRKELDVFCPDCKKPLVERRTKRGKIFYGCSGYPDCKFASWDVPLTEKCPNCKDKTLFQKSSKKTGTKKYCLDCEFESKSEAE